MLSSMLDRLVALRHWPPLSEISGDQERLLFDLWQLWLRQGALEISDASRLVGRASASTCYRNIIALEQKGLLTISVSSKDKRRRDVKFTELAEKLFASLVS